MQPRKQRFIDKKFQARFILKFCLINIAACVLIGVLVYALNQRSNTVAFEDLRVVVKSTSDFLLPLLVPVILIVTVLVALATIVITLVVSHRISGPLYGLTRQVHGLKEGDLSRPVRIRASDQLQRLAEELDAFREGLRKTLQDCQESLEAADKVARGGSPDAAAWKAVRSRVEQLKTRLDPFKTV
ncbi:MAG: hypothetical protein KBC90_18975 [Spirochaetes bacterium]|nr:hypothetical protein [Spirochaetota bacterium]